MDPLGIVEGLPMVRYQSIDRFKGKITGKSHISWENRWFPVDFPLSQPIESMSDMSNPWSGMWSWSRSMFKMLNIE